MSCFTPVIGFFRGSSVEGRKVDQQEISEKEWAACVVSSLALSLLERSILNIHSSFVSSPKQGFQNADSIAAIIPLQGQKKRREWAERHEYDHPGSKKAQDKMDAFYDHLERLDSFVQNTIWARCTLEEEETPCDEALNAMKQQIQNMCKNESHRIEQDSAVPAGDFSRVSKVFLS